MLPTNPLLNATAPAGPHLPVALLRQYAAGTLAPAAQHRVEAHTLACARCADILEGLLQTPPTTTDQALAQLQQRLRQRVQQQAAPARLAQRPRRHHWLAPQLATAAALLLAMLAAGWWAWQQRQHTASPVARVAQPRPAAAPTPPPAPDVASPAAEVAVMPPPTVAPHSVASGPAAAPKRQTSSPLVASQVATTRTKNPTPATTQPLAVPAAPVTAAADSAVPTAAVVAAAPTPPFNLDKASEPTARLRAAMPPPPALAATPTGGYAALREYLKKETADFEPETLDGPRRSGRVLVRLRIGADGKIEQAEAVRKLRADYDAEATRLLKEGPAWVPGISGGRRAAQTVEVLVEFE